MNIEIFLGGLYLTGLFFISGLGMYGFWSGMVFRQRKEETHWVAPLSFILGPIFLSWILIQLFRVIPEQSHSTYLYIILVVLGFPIIFKLRFVSVSVRQYIADIVRPRFSSKLELIVSLGVLATLFFAFSAIFFATIFVPLMGNDALEYAQVARVFVTNASLAGYPFVTGEYTGGLVAPWTHPPSFPGFFSLAYVLQGSTDYPGVVKLITPLFSVITVGALYYLVRAYSRPLALLSILVVLATPIYVFGVAGCYTDIILMGGFLAGFFTIHKLVEEFSYSRLFFAGFAAGMCLFTHSIGLLFISIAIPYYLIVSARPFAGKTLDVSVLLIIALLMISATFYTNVTVFGNPIKDNVAVWKIPELHLSEHRAYVRGLVTPADKVITGVFRGWTSLVFYGFTYWLFLIGLFAYYRDHKSRLSVQDIWVNRRWRNPSLIMSCLWFIAGYYGIVLLTVLLGMDLAIKNARYLMCIQPMIAIVAVYAVRFCGYEGGKDASVLQ